MSVFSFKQSRSFIAFPFKFCRLNISVLTFLQFFLDLNTRLKERLKSWKQTNPHISLWQREKGDTICLCFALSYSFFVDSGNKNILWAYILFAVPKLFFVEGVQHSFFVGCPIFFLFFFSSLEKNCSDNMGSDLQKSSQWNYIIFF